MPKTLKLGICCKGTKMDTEPNTNKTEYLNYTVHYKLNLIYT